jgi:serpin B
MKMKISRFLMTAALMTAAAATACQNAVGSGRPPSPSIAADEPSAPPAPSEADARALVEGNNAFALDLYARLREGTGNLAVSPASISLAFAMTYAGARGEAAEQMATTLRLTLPPERLHAALARQLYDWNHSPAKAYEMRVANRLFGEASTSFLPDFLKLTREHYRAELQELNFLGDPETARATINQWVASQTQDRIRDLIPSGAVTPDTRLVLANAIYFKGQWLTRFEPAATRDAPFIVAPGQTVTAPMMNLTASLRYAEPEGLQVLEMPYRGGDLAMTVLLPEDANGLAAMEQRLTTETLRAWLAALTSEEVIVSLPRFRAARAASLPKHLSEMGMKLPFAAPPEDARCPPPPGASYPDFTGMTGPGPCLYISDAFHKAFVDVNEAGTEAAAATSVVVSSAARSMPQELVFRADHPFVFLIRDARSGAILFMGRVANPTE